MATTSDNSQPGSRLLSIPAELRVMIYKLTATALIGRPIMMAYCPPKNRHLEQDPDFGPEMLKEYYTAHERRCENNRHALAFLHTCRQVYNEARADYLSLLCFDLRMLHMASSPPKIIRFPDRFPGVLQFIRHIELEYPVVTLFLFTPTGEVLRAEIWSDRWWDRYITIPRHVREVVRLRRLFASLQSVTIYSDPNEYDDDDDDEAEDRQAIGWRIIHRLMHQSARNQLATLFPKLEDIMCVNEEGGERFRKRCGQWELGYSREAIPSRAYEHVRGLEEDELYDFRNGLSLPTTLGCLGPPDDATVDPQELAE